MPGAPVAVPAIDLFLRLAQFGQVGMQQIVRGLEAMSPAFKVRPPDAIHHVDMIEGADHVVEHRHPLFFDFARRKRRKAFKQTLIGPAFVIGQQAGSAYSDHQKSPMAVSALPSIDPMPAMQGQH
ncbi:hypothetical protein D3C81_1684610 [compost metagenome]